MVGMADPPERHLTRIPQRSSVNPYPRQRPLVSIPRSATSKTVDRPWNGATCVTPAYMPTRRRRPQKALACQHTRRSTTTYHLCGVDCSYSAPNSSFCQSAANERLPHHLEC
jgi:hypothetical protein